jgi:hypothetical protein
LTAYRVGNAGVFWCAGDGFDGSFGFKPSPLRLVSRPVFFSSVRDRNAPNPFSL